MNNLNFDELKKETVKLENTTFQIHKLPALKAMEVMELIRVSLAEQFDATDSMDGIFKAILKLPVDKFQDIQDRLFSVVTFTNDTDYKVPQKLDNIMRQSAFAKLDAFDIYDLTIRCLVRNFFCSFQKLQKFTQLLGLTGVPTKSKPLKP